MRRVAAQARSRVGPFGCVAASTGLDWPLTLAVTGLAITGSLAGARLATRVPAQLLRTSFGWFLTAMAALVLVEQAPTTLRHALAGTFSGRTVLAGAMVALALAAARLVRSSRTLAISPER